MQQAINFDLASRYLLATGVLSGCGVHGAVYRGGVSDLEGGFWKKAMIDRMRGDRGPASWAAGLKAVDYIDILTRVYESQTSQG
ncbi:hypothetical protein ACQZ4Y_19845 [Rhizobium sp. L80/93]|uniref:hypothetical protein n=1 Tax=unclassified Rhizobium TaxID=2613769 RepID=UPI001ADA16A9|nr:MULTISPECIES: hypothetical protein [unclassified Rhizobium]MBO9135158.1 hypothetical protein [Rhizobium sp. B209b/85]MBO9188082.1 hypothetical protein [Rhizobium sp. E27B/91]QXZ99051.1 hypothetical protein J5289_21365 [Rhizobium sp. B230/85]